ncbi:glycosyl hydrolase 115 family protein, partial [uncultured Muribaculum sp.]
MYEELKKAYDTGADRYWLLNVGDIKPMELAVQTFFD